MYTNKIPDRNKLLRFKCETQDVYAYTTHPPQNTARVYLYITLYINVLRIIPTQNSTKMLRAAPTDN